MFNITLIIGLILIGISQDILILNEETLILFCFTLFCSLIYINYNKSIFEIFNLKKKEIKQNLKKSFDKICKQLQSQIFLEKDILKIKTDNIQLKEHLIEFNSQLINRLPNHKLNKTKSIILKKLYYTKHLEEQLLKLITLILLQKITKNANLLFFAHKKLKINTFKSNYKICLRESIEFIKCEYR